MEHMTVQGRDHYLENLSQYEYNVAFESVQLHLQPEYNEDQYITYKLWERIRFNIVDSDGTGVSNYWLRQYVIDELLDHFEDFLKPTVNVLKYLPPHTENYLHSEYLIRLETLDSSYDYRQLFKALRLLQAWS